MKRSLFLLMVFLATICWSKAQAPILITFENAKLVQGELQLDWSLGYDGPEAELTILEPGFTRSTFGQTRLQVEAWSPKGRHVGNFESAYLAGRYVSYKDWFISVKRGQTVSGTCSVPLRQITFSPPVGSIGELRKQKLRLVHAPTDKGHQHGLKAWTGELATPWVDAPLALGSGH
jgi:hypothetical protein